MLIPLGVLAVGSIAAGFSFLHVFEGDGAAEFFRNSLMVGPNNHVLEEMEHVSIWVKLAPFVMMALGLLLDLYCVLLPFW